MKLRYEGSRHSTQSYLAQEGRKLIMPEKLWKHFSTEVFDISKDNVLPSGGPRYVRLTLIAGEHGKQLAEKRRRRLPRAFARVGCATPI